MAIDLRIVAPLEASEQSEFTPRPGRINDPLRPGPDRFHKFGRRKHLRVPGPTHHPPLDFLQTRQFQAQLHAALRQILQRLRTVPALLANVISYFAVEPNHDVKASSARMHAEASA